MTTSNKKMKILLADDERSIRLTLTNDLKAENYDVIAVDNGDKAYEIAINGDVDCVIADLKMPGLNGIELTKRIKKDNPDVGIIIISGYGTIETAVEAVKLGADNFVEKPFLNEKIIHLIKQIEKVKNLREERDKYKEELFGRYKFGNLVGKSKKMQEIYNLIETIACRDTTVLIQGESGTGKELTANAIHYNSQRSSMPFIKFSCSSLPESLIEAELFGHEKGAYTDAKEMRIGRFERANGGTIFIDDIDDMNLSAQTKFLRILQEKELERIGGNKIIKVDIRVIAATKVDLKNCIRNGKFREDLFFRLNVVSIHLPPLRERKDDIPILIEHFLKRYGGEKSYNISRATFQSLYNYDWPGNVRELENAIERAIVLSKDSNELKIENLLGAPSISVPQKVDETLSITNFKSLDDALRYMEKKFIGDALKKVGGKKYEAAKLLNVSRKFLWKKLKEYNSIQHCEEDE